MRATILSAALLAMTAACATAGEPSDGQSQAAGDSYPSLRDVPRTHEANVDADHWAALEQELLAAGQAVRSNPRARPASEAEDPAAFLEDAQRELEQARDAHTP
jgi:hypothetical protein